MMRWSQEVSLVGISLVVALGLSLYAGQMQAATTLPIEDNTLQRHFYKKTNTCANVEAFVKHQVKLWYDKDKSITAKLLKLLYADCMVNGCDASILLDGIDTEKTAFENAQLGGFVLIDKIKTVLESYCPRAVSCADILNLATRDAVHMAGAPSYPVFLGRRDGLESKRSWVDLPSPEITIEEGLAYFKSKGLDSQDYATLLGAHTMGKTRCIFFQQRLYGKGAPREMPRDPSMSEFLWNRLTYECRSSNLPGHENTAVFLNDKGKPEEYRFTNTYYSNVLSHDAVLRVDRDLLLNYNTSQLVLEYSVSFENLRRMFALSISRMGGLRVLTGKQGEIRRNCRLRNKNNPELN